MNWLPMLIKIIAGITMFFFYTLFWLYVCVVYKAKTIEYCRTIGYELIGNYVIQCNVKEID